MLVYIIAFALTLLFVNLVADYRRSVFKPALVGGTVTKLNGKYSRRINLKYILLVFLAVFPLFFISAVRYDVGTDYMYTYVPNFYAILAGQNAYSERGFNLLNRAIQLFTHNPQWLFVITSLLFVSLMIRTIVVYSSNVTVSVAVLFFSCIYFASLNNVRQAVAVVIVFSAFSFIVRGKFVKYILCVLVACLFHKASIVMVLPFIAVNLKFVRRHFLFYAVIATLFIPVMCLAMRSVLVHTKYYYYFVSDFNNGNSNRLNIIYNLFFFVVAYALLRKSFRKDKYGYVLLFMQFTAFWISGVSLFIRISEMISRIAVFLQVFQILLIPYCISIQRTRRERAAVAFVFLAPYAVYMFYFIVMNNYHAVLPYKWIF